jgi:hypothetical protein
MNPAKAGRTKRIDSYFVEVRSPDCFRPRVNPKWAPTVAAERKREGSSMVWRNVNAVTAPMPGLSRRVVLSWSAKFGQSAKLGFG